MNNIYHGCSRRVIWSGRTLRGGTSSRSPSSENGASNQDPLHFYLSHRSQCLARRGMHQQFYIYIYVINIIKEYISRNIYITYHFISPQFLLFDYMSQIVFLFWCSYFLFPLIWCTKEWGSACLSSDFWPWSFRVGHENIDIYIYKYIFATPICFFSKSALASYTFKDIYQFFLL